MTVYLWAGGPGDYFARDDIVFYDADGNRLAHRFGQPSRTGFFPKSIDLDASESWLFNGQAATGDQIRMVLSDVADLFVRAEYFDHAGDRAAMDLFSVVQPD
jgi:hypothetical protein